MTHERYTTTDVAKIGVKRERLKEWMGQGYIQPSIQKASGTGTWNLFSRNDLYMIKLFVFLLARGFSRKEAAIRVKACSIAALHKDFNFVALYKKSDSDDDIFGEFYKDWENISADFGDSDYWSDILIINFRALKRQVDAVIA
jgi:hypothetical protein